MKYLPVTTLIASAVALCCSAAVSGPAPIYNGQLHIHVVDAYGVVVPYKVKSLKSKMSPDRELAPLFKDITITGLSGGGYDYVLSPRDATIWTDVSGYVRVGVDEQRWLTVVASRREMVQATWRIDPASNRGRIVGLDPLNGPIWVRLLHAFNGATVEETAVDRDGRFRFSYLHWGKHIVVVYQGAEVKYLHTVMIDGVLKKVLELKVSSSGG